MTAEPGDSSPGAGAAPRLDRYLLGDRIGAGGMGVVYRAHDTRLGRNVAVKLLPETFAHDADRVRRFEHEARAAAALGHANILAVYDVGEHDGSPFIVTELLEGETLRERIEAGALTVAKSLELALQIARGLAAAHDKGIVHRDLKPDNVFVTSDGTVKILDFGLAKLTQLEEPGEDVTGVTTEPPPTASGTVLGTVGYMAPEQVRGQPADQRADVFALGCVLYEMLCGRRAFKGATPADTSAAILQSDPAPLAASGCDVPETLQRVVLRCLEKRPEDRFGSARDVMFALKAATATLPAVRLRLGRRWRVVRRLAWIGASVAVLVALAAGGAATWQRWFATPALPDMKRLAVVRFAAAGSGADDAAYAAGLGAMLEDSLLLLEEQTRGSLWIYPKPVPSAAVLEEARKGYGVNLGLTGRVTASSDRRRVALALVDPASGRTLRTAAVEDHPANLKAWQSGLMAAVAGMLGFEVQPATSARLEARATNVTQAFEDFLEGLGTSVVAQEGIVPQAAVERLRAATTEDPVFTPAGVALARALLSEHGVSKDPEKLQAAAEAAERAVATAKDPCDALLVLADVREAAGRAEARIDALERAIRACPNRAEAHLQFGRTYQAMKRNTEAEAEFQRAIYLRPGYWPAHHWLARLYYGQEGRGEAAANQFLQVTASAPDSYIGYNNLAVAYDRLDRREDSRAALLRSLELQPDNNPNAIKNLGKIYYDEGNFAAAVEMFRRSDELQPGNPLTVGNLAYALASIGEREQAEAAARRGIELNEKQLVDAPSNAELLVRLAGLHAIVGEGERGIVRMEQAIATAPEDPGVIASIAGTWEDLGDRDRALEWVERAFAAGIQPSRFENRPMLRALVADERYRALAGARTAL